MQTSDPDTVDIFDLKLAYAILRVTLGINMLMHGAVRIMAGLSGFAEGMVKQFAETPLPAVFVRAFGHTVPVFEVTIGLLILLGIQTRWALAAGGLFMASLVFGTSLRSDWNMVMLQMIYAVIFYLLLARHRDNAFTLGAMFGANRTGER